MKKVLLYAPDWIGIVEAFRKNLSYCGFDTDVLSFTKPEFKYKSTGQRIINFFRKTFLRDFGYKQRLKEAYFEHNKEAFITKYHSYDYALIIRADLLSMEALGFVQSVSAKMISYHFDGLGRYPTIFERIHFFDDFFVFDPEDVNRYPGWNLRPITNFYFDYPLPQRAIQLKDFEFYYLGTYHIDRIQQILDLQQFLSTNNRSYQFELIFPPKDANRITPELTARILCSTDAINFEDYLVRMSHAPHILDFVLNEHSGVSFRAFESIQYEKKLITTNKSIVHYEFYHPDNIFILDNNYDAILDFLKKPYQRLPSVIRKKYAFSNWVKNVFSLNPFEKISTPQITSYDL